MLSKTYNKMDTCLLYKSTQIFKLGLMVVGVYMQGENNWLMWELLRVRDV